MATNERRRERYRLDETYRERRIRQVQEARQAQRVERQRQKRLKGWADIATAPENEVIMLYDPTVFWPILASLKDGEWNYVHYDGPRLRPTHWRYLIEMPRL